MAAFRTLWAALVSLYDETLVLVGANLATVALNLPLALLLFLIGLPFFSTSEGPGTQWLVAIIVWLMPFMPTPGNLALAGVTRVAAGPDVPRLALFRESLREHWRLALRATLVSLVVIAALAWNVTFYLGQTSGLLQFVSILWLYAVVFWLSVHIYFVSLAVHVAEPRLFDLYRRAIFIALGHPVYTLLVLLVLLVFAFAAVVFLPVYLLVGPAFVSLTQAQALREIRRRHGDLVETDEEVSRL
jgi:uncharacterized membrane protein YesL